MVVSGYIFWSFLYLNTWVLFKVSFYFLPWLCSLQKSPFFRNISETLAKSMESWSSWLTCCFADSKPLSDCYFFHATTLQGWWGRIKGRIFFLNRSLRVIWSDWAVILQCSWYHDRPPNGRATCLLRPPTTILYVHGRGRRVLWDKVDVGCAATQEAGSAAQPPDRLWISRLRGLDHKNPGIEFGMGLKPNIFLKS